MTILCQHLAEKIAKALVLPQKVLNVTHMNVLVSPFFCKRETAFLRDLVMKDVTSILIFQSVLQHLFFFRNDFFINSYLLSRYWSASLISV